MEVLSTANSWEAYGFFEATLSSFIDIRARIGNHIALLPEPLSFAKEGYAEIQPYDTWSDSHIAFIENSLAGVFSESALRSYGKAVPWIRCYGCMVDGGMLGLFSTAQIDEATMWHGSMLLPTFLSENEDRIAPK